MTGGVMVESSASTPTVVVRILAVHVGCHACGDTARIEDPANEADAFTRTVLEPLASWWVAHTRPELGMIELTVDGKYAEWEAVRP